MKILWISDNPFVNSSYTLQSKLLISFLRKYHEIIYYGITYNGTETSWEGIPVVGNSYDLDKGLINYYVTKYNVDIVFTMKDPNYFPTDIMKKLDVPWVAFAPIDTEPANIALKNYLHYAMVALTPTQWSKWSLEEYMLPVMYTPHGLDSNFFTIDKAEEFRKRFFIEPHQKVYNFVGANNSYPSRKNIDLLLMLWADFSRRHPEEVVLFLHTNTMGSVKLGVLLEALDISEYSYRFTPQDEYFAGCSDKYVRDIYRASDWGIYLSGGEGFNLPVVENQLCGVPIIGTRFTAHRETIQSGIVLEQQQSELQYDASGGFRIRPQYDTALEALELSLKTPYNPLEVRQSILKYDLQNVIPYWVEAFAKIEDQLRGKLA